MPGVQSTSTRGHSKNHGKARQRRRLAPLHCCTTTPQGPHGRERVREGRELGKRREDSIHPQRYTTGLPSQRSEHTVVSWSQQRPFCTTLHIKDVSRPCSGHVACSWTRPGAAGLSAISSHAPPHRQLIPLDLTAPHVKRLGCRRPDWRSEGRSQSMLIDGPSPTRGHSSLQAFGEGRGEETAEVDAVHTSRSTQLCVGGNLWVGKTRPYSPRPRTSNPIKDSGEVSLSTCACGLSWSGVETQIGWGPASAGTRALKLPLPMGQKIEEPGPCAALHLDQTTHTHTHAGTPNARAQSWQYSPTPASLRGG